VALLWFLSRSKRRQHSSGRSLGNLDPVHEDFPMEQEVRDFKMRRLSDFEPTPGWLHFFPLFALLYINM
jgi:cohesin complex subunit SCC1